MGAETDHPLSILASKQFVGNADRMPQLCRRNLFILVISLLMPSLGFCSLPDGCWSISGTVTDMRRAVTNTLSLTGHCSNGCFIIDLVPIKTEDETEESAGWDGHDLFRIARWPKARSQGLPRTERIGIIEPTVFSHYSTPALVGVLIGFADSNQLSRLESGNEIVILQEFRQYPEENNTYTVDFLSSGGIQVTARCPGLKIGSAGTMLPVPGFEKGFTRWTYSSSLKGPNTLLGEYERFTPYEGKLVRTRKVVSEIMFMKEDAGPNSFQPEIPEDRLNVWDCSQRQTLFEFYKKGLMDQVHIYELTNHSWNFAANSNITAIDFADRKARFFAKGIAADLIDAPSNAEPPGSTKRRAAILCVLIAVSVLFAAVIYFNSRQTSPKQKT